MAYNFHTRAAGGRHLRTFAAAKSNRWLASVFPLAVFNLLVGVRQCFI
jgi:hypothetical protein